MLYYILTKLVSGSTYVLGLEASKRGASDWKDIGSDYDYVHWDLDVDGDAPKIDSDNAWVDERSYGEQRATAYKMESDRDYIKYKTKTTGDGDDDSTSKAEWVAARNAIKNKYKKPWADCTVAADTNKVTDTAHGMLVDQKVEFSGTLPIGITLGVSYYIIWKDSDNFTISTTEGGSEFDFTDTGSSVKFRRVY